MRYETQTIRVGENMGPVDWSHSIAAGLPEAWREAEAAPERYTYNGRPIVALGMYDGWPYWTPRPAVQFIGPMRSAEWAYFDSYGATPGSIQPAQAMETRQGGDATQAPGDSLTARSEGCALNEAATHTQNKGEG